MSNLVDLIPEFALEVLRPLYYVVVSSQSYRILWRLCYKLPAPLDLSRDGLNYYWKHCKQPRDIQQYYMGARGRSKFLVEMIQRHAASNARILEIGCGVGRNLYDLFVANFKNLEGIEISKEAV